MSEQLCEALEKKRAAAVKLRESTQRTRALAEQLRNKGTPARGPPDKRALPDLEAAEYIGMSVWYLRQARYQGDIGNRTPGPDYIKIGRAVRYLINDLDCWLEQHRVRRPANLQRRSDD